MVGPRGCSLSYERGAPAGFRILGSRSDVYQAGQGLGLVCGLRALGRRFRVPGFRHGFWVQGILCRVKGVGYRVHGVWYRVFVVWCMVYGAGCRV